MGCLTSKDASSSSKKSNDKKKGKEKGAEKGGYSWDKQREGINPDDFVVRKLNGQVVVKEPGSVNGQQFIIEDCEDCDIFVCDFSASVTVDNCTNCRLFVGPVESSIFVRNCKGCKCIIACHQWRTRDCQDMDVFLYTLTQPIIEASTQMRFGCFQFYYPSLEEQFTKAKLNALVNQWSNLYDFTPGENHWSYIPKDVVYTSYFKSLPPVIPEDAPKKASVVPLTWGNRPMPSSQNGLVVIFSNHKSKVAEFCNDINSFEGGKLAVAQIIEKEIAADILANGVDASNLKQPAIVIEINGDDVIPSLQALAPQFTTKCGDKLENIMYISPSLEAAKESIGKIFEQVNIEI